ncbi:oligosaccharyltransferase complex subunit epsilon [Cryptococcus bacillisporus CA1873]|uniref:Dolichyl-diphosphooligosaccharide--protein glycosyltransferase subunit OST2 n=1 Tax=Cryptococcus bacillisporus CA1873 TaxID=1296111 RepID=A0ABR5BJF0_CRYGA|nr:oligosaccharyltransferase complex subunit epsilon [Cryptococcus bacillisporus CA1873]|eukprot:KIR69286.1 oligosaccharyltransferase complex subunit epsilon [Cryptococcus gattii CA1873]
MSPKTPQPTVNSKNLQSSFDTLIDNYTSTTPVRVKLIDAFLLFILLSGVLQFAYRLLITVYPFHAFAGGFGSTVGQFVLLAGFRAQVAPGRDGEFKEVPQERAFADFCAASVILHLFAFNFLG